MVGDIRFYGNEGSKTVNKSKKVIENEILCQIEHLRTSKVGDTLLPNLVDRVKAGFLIDKIEKGEAIHVDSKKQVRRRPIQKSGPENISVVGSDVCSLFPSIKNVEAARFVRHAVLNSDVQIENFDHLIALRYLTIVGGADLLRKVGVSRLAPRWLGGRADLVSLGGKKSRDPSSWRDTKMDIRDFEKRKIVAAVLEILVNLVMSTHVYVFCGRYFLQKLGGPIGLRSTATIAALIMKLWDQAWVKLLDREGLRYLDFFRYVDDVRNFVWSLYEGWRWNGESFEFRLEW